MSEQNTQNGKKNNTTTILLILGAILLICIICSLVGTFGYFWFQRQAEEAAQSSTEELEEQFKEFDKIFEDTIEEAEKQQEEQNNSETEDEQNESNNQSTETDSREIAVIEGSLSYPSEGIPSDLYVCAEDVNSNQEYCTYEQITAAKYQYNKGYKIEVPAGTYNVYAAIPGDPNYKSYYSEFVTCGLSVDCPSHDPIDVTVGEGETKTAIDPADWYAQ